MTTTLQNLSKALEGYVSQEQQELQIFKNKPFYCKWTNYIKKDWCTNENPRCFNHMIGMPVKNGIAHELYDYEQDIINYLEREDNPNDSKNKHLYILKSAGLGITTLLLRYIAWKCTTNNDWSGGRVCILTAPRLDLTIDLVDRLKGLFNNYVQFTEKNTVCYLNNVRIEGFPSHLGLKGMRGLTDIKMIVCDEASYFDLSQIQEARETIERYWAKSDPTIVLCSTPARPQDLMDLIKQEPEDKCIYKRMFLSYKTGLDKIYTAKEIALQRQSPSFEKEFNLRFEFGVGNVFHYEDIDAAANTLYDLRMDNPYAIRHLGCDPAFGSSQFGIVITEWFDGMLSVLYADSFDRILFNDAIEKVIALAETYNVCKILVDGANPSVIKSLKQYYGSSEFMQYELLKPEVVDKWVYSECAYNKVCPVNFRLKHKEILQKAHRILSKRKIRIDPKFTKLTTSLRTATAKGEWDLDKNATSHSDVLDAYMLAQMPIQFNFRQE